MGIHLFSHRVLFMSKVIEEDLTACPHVQWSNFSLLSEVRHCQMTGMKRSTASVYSLKTHGWRSYLTRIDPRIPLDGSGNQTGTHLNWRCVLSWFDLISLLDDLSGNALFDSHTSTDSFCIAKLMSWTLWFNAGCLLFLSSNIVI